SRGSRLAPPSGGQIARLRVEKGDRVKAGEVLLELWHEDIKAQLLLAERDAAAAQARAEEVCVAAKVARSEADRLQKLLARKLVAEDVVDQAQGGAESRAAACRAAREA